VSVVEFLVHGEPAPQGSKTVGRSTSGRPFVREDNPNTAPWRNAVAAAAHKAMLVERDDDGPTYYRDPIGGPVRLEVVFVFSRPRSHFGTGRNAGLLKPSAPMFAAKLPDVDKLVRAIGDALTGVVLVDDSRVVELRAEKRYGAPRAYVTVTELAG
jgi:Holliday junction resolvase RusA-like endonuclease